MSNLRTNLLAKGMCSQATGVRKVKAGLQGQGQPGLMWCKLALKDKQNASLRRRPLVTGTLHRESVYTQTVSPPHSVPAAGVSMSSLGHLLKCNCHCDDTGRETFKK